MQGADLGTVLASGYLLAVDAGTGPVCVAGSAGRLTLRDARRGGLLRTVAVGRSAGARVIFAAHLTLCYVHGRCGS